MPLEFDAVGEPHPLLPADVLLDELVVAPPPVLVLEPPPVVAELPPPVDGAPDVELAPDPVSPPPLLVLAPLSPLSLLPFPFPFPFPLSEEPVAQP